MINFSTWSTSIRVFKSWFHQHFKSRQTRIWNTDIISSNALGVSWRACSVEPTTILFGDISLVTCLLGSTFSSGVKCGADEKFFLWNSLSVFTTKVQCACWSGQSITFSRRGAFPGKYYIHMRQRMHRRLILLSSSRRVSLKILWWRLLVNLVTP